MQPDLQTIESALAAVQELPSDVGEAVLCIAHGATWNGQSTNPDVVESLLLNAILARTSLMPCGTETHEHARLYKYAKKSPRRPDAAEPCDA